MQLSPIHLVSLFVRCALLQPLMGSLPRRCAGWRKTHRTKVQPTTQRRSPACPHRETVRIHFFSTPPCARLIYPCSGDQPYIPPMRPYELSELARDLVLLARYMLKPNGRLVFFLPTITDEYTEIDVRDMLCDDMELVANSLQNFGSWGRRVRSRIYVYCSYNRRG